MMLDSRTAAHHREPEPALRLAGQEGPQGVPVDALGSQEPALSEAPPHSLDAEGAVLGAALKHGLALAEVVPFLKPAAFYHPPHRHVYAALVNLFEHRYLPESLPEGEDWNLRQPEIYKHFFLAYSRQVKQLAAVEGRERVRIVRRWIDDAIANYERLQGVIFDDDSGSAHLKPWLTVVAE
jgi:DnaB-like helicase N terminal domain